MFAGLAWSGNGFVRRVLTSAQDGSEEGQELLLKAAGVGGGALLPQLTGPQDHGIDVAFELQGPLEAAPQFIGAEGEEGALIHGLTGRGPGSGVMAGT